jgi:hypothetical protein
MRRCLIKRHINRVKIPLLKVFFCKFSYSTVLDLCIVELLFILLHACDLVDIHHVPMCMCCSVGGALE